MSDTTAVSATSAHLRALVARLDEASKRYRAISRLTTSGADNMRLSKRLAALSSIARSRRYAAHFSDDLLREYERLPITRYADKIIAELPGGKIPGYED